MTAKRPDKAKRGREVERSTGKMKAENATLAELEEERDRLRALNQSKMTEDQIKAHDKRFYEVLRQIGKIKILAREEDAKKKEARSK